MLELLMQERQDLLQERQDLLQDRQEDRHLRGQLRQQWEQQSAGETDRALLLDRTALQERRMPVLQAQRVYVLHCDVADINTAQTGNRVCKSLCRCS
jgi:hypothetical protein